ncbi:MAG: glucose-6-phosphate dehydrogenase [Gemmatimonadota bacterium]|nr:glucose-6-phosphate dehydrogenase [Gemmatimonadota bacterium]
MTRGTPTATARVERHQPAPPPRRADPCTAIILGAGGDLTGRLLLPAFCRLAAGDLLHEGFLLVGVDRQPLDDTAFRAHLRTRIAGDEPGAVSEAAWEKLAPRIRYVSGDLTDPTAYAAIATKLAELEQDHAPEHRNRLFYLAVPPVIFDPIITQLAASGIAPRIESCDVRPWVRIVVEKPFGDSLESAMALNEHVLELFDESQVYRIDHYLGKETVQNLLVFRFGNSIFEPLWNRAHIAHVEITSSETLGVETRGRYYEKAGVMRDMFQNHLLQLLSLTAMEPPVTMSADAVRDEKVKVLRSVRWLKHGTVDENAVRAQYAGGSIGGQLVRGYREEENVAPDSVAPTYAAVRFLIDNWRWSGVPFYVRSGKRMARRLTEIVIQFHRPPLLMFGHETRGALAPNKLVLRIQPKESIALTFEAKTPGAALSLTPEIEVASVAMNFCYSDVFGGSVSPAYETLLLDVMVGEATLFTRSDEVEASWRIVDPIIHRWERFTSKKIPTYRAGSWGPDESDDLLREGGAEWRNPDGD